MEFDELSNLVIGCALEVHRNLGPGLLESSYQQCMAHEMRISAIPFMQQVPLPVEYKGIMLNCGYRLDFLIDNSLIVELKSVERLMPIHHAQLMTYLKLSKVKTGLLINFNSILLKDNIKRIIL